MKYTYHKSGDIINGVKLISTDIPKKGKQRCGIFECPYCGKHFISTIVIISRNVHRLRVPSCGCMKVIDKTTHNLSKHKIHTIWANMISRTTCAKHKCYKNYGGRGIKMCVEWRQDFKEFYDWAMANGYNEKLTIDRKNSEGDYSPENCRFTTREVQNRNRRRSIPSKYPAGVVFSAKYNHYYSRIGVNSKVIHLGTFNTIEDAVQSRKDYAKKHNLIGFYNE
jgi:hypothetical protein